GLQVGHALSVEPLIRERTLHQTIGAHAPASFPTARGQVDVFASGPEPQQHAPSRRSAFPLLPVALPHATANPFVQLQHLAPRATDPVVAEPSLHVTAQRPESVFHGYTPCAFGHPAHVCAEFLQGGRTPTDLLPLDATAQEGALRQPVDAP